MATTYELIASTTLGSDTASVTFGSGGTIPQTYTDLLILISGRTNRGGGEITDRPLIRFNGAADNSNLSARELTGSGGSASSATRSDGSLGIVAASASTANSFGSLEAYIPNYAGSTHKSYSSTAVQETNASTAYIYAMAGLWSSTAAINQIELLPQFGSWVTGSSFYLYGITKA